MCDGPCIKIWMDDGSYVRVEENMTIYKKPYESDFEIEATELFESNYRPIPNTKTDLLD